MSGYILVTGGNGFLGRAFSISAIAAGYKVRIVARKKVNYCDISPDCIQVSDLLSTTEWSSALLGVESIVHCAARVHIMREVEHDPLKAFRAVNVEGTLNLAHQAALSGVKRFIFISSIKVNGESTVLGNAFTESNMPNPGDAYAQSKYEAELGLKRIGLQTGMEIVIIRPTLVYGPGVKANFLSMMNWLQWGFPLPLGGITNNLRSFVFIDNLVDMIICCINHPAAANQIFLVSDDGDLSTMGLLQRMALALGRPSKLIAVPPALITLGARLVGRADVAQRLCGSLQVDIKKSKDLLAWSPPVSVDEGLHQTAKHFLRQQS